MGGTVVSDIGVAVASIFHIIFGALYFGSDIFAEFVLFRGLEHAENVGEMKVFQKLFKRSVPIFILSAMGTLVTGLLYLGVKYHTLDPGVLWNIPAAQLILVALLLFVVLFVIAARVLAPSSKKLIERDFGTDATAPIPADFKETLDFMGKATHLQTTLIIVVIVLMILAANGGI